MPPGTLFLSRKISFFEKTRLVGSPKDQIKQNHDDPVSKNSKQALKPRIDIALGDAGSKAFDDESTYPDRDHRHEQVDEVVAK